MQIDSREILFERDADQYSRALELAIAATQTVPGCPEYEFTKGVALFRQGRFDEANEVLESVESMEWNVMNDGTERPGTLEVYSHAIRAMALHQLGNLGLAQEQLAMAQKGIDANGASRTAIREIVTESETMLGEK